MCNLKKKYCLSEICCVQNIGVARTRIGYFYNIWDHFYFFKKLDFFTILVPKKEKRWVSQNLRWRYNLLVGKHHFYNNIFHLRSRVKGQKQIECYCFRHCFTRDLVPKGRGNEPWFGKPKFEPKKVFAKKAERPERLWESPRGLRM